MNEGAETGQLKLTSRLVRGNRGVSCWAVIWLRTLVRWRLARLPDFCLDFVANFETARSLCFGRPPERLAHEDAPCSRRARLPGATLPPPRRP